MRRGIEIENYPAIKKHLENLKDKLTPKPADWKGEWNGRKPGSYKWFEIQDTIAYYPDFEKEKIVYPTIGKEPRFTFDDEKYFTGDTTFIIPRKDFFLLHDFRSFQFS